MSTDIDTWVAQNGGIWDFQEWSRQHSAELAREAVLKEARRRVRAWQPKTPRKGTYADLYPHLRLPDLFILFSRHDYEGGPACARVYLALTSVDLDQLFAELVQINPGIVPHVEKIRELWLFRAQQYAAR
jgi:hypothetical protein